MTLAHTIDPSVLDLLDINLDDVVLEKARSDIQSLLFDNSKFTRAQAVKWAKDHDFHSSKVDKTEDKWRLRQKEPGECQDFATITLTAGVKGVLCIMDKEKCGWVEKLTQDETEYDPLGASATEGCANCRWFQMGGECRLVESYPTFIMPTGTCNRWEGRPTHEPQPLEVIVVDDQSKETKREGGVDYPASDFAVVPDSTKPSEWKLRLAEGSPGHLTVAQIGRAITALQPGGFRGQPVDLTSSQRSSAISKISGAIGRIAGATDEQKAALRDRLDKVKEVSLWGRFQAALKGRFAPKGDSSFVLFKDQQGDIRWFAWASNKFRDIDSPPEILMDKAHREYVDYVDRSGNYPEAWLWHTPKTRWGKADWVDYADGFLLVSGTVDPGMEHVADALSKMRNLGVSHGFRYRHENKQQGTIGWYRTFEVSPLPVEAAANPWTSIEVLTKEIDMFTGKKREFMVNAIGEEEVARLENDTKALREALEAAGVDWKELPEDDPIDIKALASEAAKAAAEALVETPAFKALTETANKTQQDVEALAGRVDALEKSDDEKVAKALGAARASGGYRASTADKTVLSEEEATRTKEESGGPNFFDQIMEGLELRPTQ